MILGNVFGRTPTARMLFHKLESDIHQPLKTVLLYLEYIDDDATIDDISVVEIPMDMRLAEILKRL
jgi:hypothetical protein